MTIAVFYKLLAIFLTVALGWAAGRMRWLGERSADSDPVRVLGNAAFYIFLPALLFRTTARLDLAALPWGTIAFFFVPALVVLFTVYGWQRRRIARARGRAAEPAVRALSASFGNLAQIGIPMATALFGEAGLAIHISIVSLHALILLTTATALVESDVARAQTRRAAFGATLANTVRNTVIHPVVLPVLSGLTWNLTGLGLHPVADEVLANLGSAVVPVCLVLIGITLAYYRVQGQVRPALTISALKLIVQPALVLVIAHWGFGVNGLALSVIVIAAAMPTGSNALLLAQRYGALQSEASAVIAISTLAFGVTSSMWLGVLALLSRQ